MSVTTRLEHVEVAMLMATFPELDPRADLHSERIRL